MNAVILAAGLGTRLHPLTLQRPKCLVTVGGKEILRWQLEGLSSAGVTRIYIVTGYKASMVQAFCQALDLGIEVTCITNTIYHRTNNLYSCLQALQGIDDDCLVINGDLLFDSIIPAMLLNSTTANSIAVRLGVYDEEAMKVKLDDAYRLLSISKALAPEEACGIGMDMYKFSRESIRLLRKIGQQLIEEHGASLWTEAAIDRLARHLDIFATPVRTGRWIEIDSLAELELAEELFGRHGDGTS